MIPILRVTRHPAFSLALTGLLCSLTLACWTETALYSPQTGWDFPVFYIAARVPLHSLYDANAFAEYWRTHLQSQGVPHWAPFVRLPVFVIPLHYFLRASYYPALYCWIALGGAAYIAGVGLLLWRLRLPLPLLAACLAYFPAAVGILNGADIGFYFLILVLAFLLLERESQWLAAAALTLCLSKYNLIALIPLVLAFQKRYRAFCGFIAGALLVVFSSMSLTSIQTYLAALKAAPALAGHFAPVGLRGFTNAVRFPSLYPLLAALVILICCWLFRALDLRNSVAVAVTGTLMVVPYVTWYDSTLLILPILVVFSQSGRIIRSSCVLVLVAIPLWVRGGGFGPVGFTHISIEVLLLAWFVWKAGALSMPGIRRYPQFRVASGASVVETLP